MMHEDEEKTTVDGGKPTVDKFDKKLETFDKFDKWDRRRHVVQAAEIGMNANDHVENLREVVQQVNEGAQVFQVMNADATEAGMGADAVDIDTVNMAVQDAAANGELEGVAGATEGAEGIMEAQAAENIVEGHRHFECIENTCLEEPVRVVTEECAIPIYKCLGETCFSCCCNNSAEQAGETTAETTADANEGLGCMESCFDGGLCGLLDSASWCVLDDALAYALPFLGTMFSCYRLYQGTLLSCNGMIGRYKSTGKIQKLRFQWMAAEGNARLWQGCCGLIGAAPGLIIVTLPVILACGLMAGKAKKKRKALEPGGAKNEESKTGDGVIKTQPSAEAFPSPDELKNDYNKAYRVVTGEKVSGEESIDGVDQELLRHYEVSQETSPYPNAPRGEWSTGIFDCFEHFPSCVTGCFCSCITTGQVAEGARLFKGVFYATVAAYLIDWIIGFGGILIMIFGTYVIAKSRSRIGKVYGIPVDPLGNCCLSFWCGCCAASQVARHLFAWDSKHAGQCEGWMECGPRPLSRWPQVSMGRQTSWGNPSSVVGYSSAVHQQQPRAAFPPPPPPPAATDVPPSYQQFQSQQQNATTAPAPPAYNQMVAPSYNQMVTPSYDQMVKGHAPSAVAPMDRC